MKANQILALALSAVMFTFTACSESNDEPTDVTPTNITLSTTTLEVAEGATANIAAVVTPSNASGNITWESEDQSIATVANGVVTGIKAGSTTIVASIGSLSASCAVTVTKSTSGADDASLKGSNYFIIFLDGTSEQAISGKIVHDFRPNDDTNNLFIWDNTYTAGSTTGPNSYGEVEGWISLVVGNVGWSGFGMNSTDLNGLNKLSVVSENPSDYYLHIAMKSRSTASHLIGIDGTQGKAAICLGSSSFVDNGTTYAPYASFTADGEWNVYDIPMTEFTNQGLVFRNDNTEGKNLLWGLSGGVTGTGLELDAIFIYKK